MSRYDEWKSSIGRSPSARRPAILLALGTAVLIILVATLSPSYEAASSEGPLCLPCGARGAADAIDNILLFIPLGAALGLAGLTSVRALLVGAGLSLFVELAQFAIVPGRDASASDLLFNTVGAGSGYWALRMRPRAALVHPAMAGWLSAAAAALALSAVAMTGYLLRPSLPQSSYAGQWTESPGNLEMYRGRVLEATLGSEPVPPRPLEQSGKIRDLLLARGALDIRLTAGPPTRRLGQLFAIVEQGDNREVLLLGVHGDDLVLRYRTRADDLRLDAGALRVSNALAGLSPGSAVRLVIWGEADGYCVSVNGIRTCQLAFTAANGWMVLYSVDSWSTRVSAVIGAAWLAALFMPVGFWLRRHWSSLLALLLLSVGLTALPGAVGLSPPSAIESGGAVLGLVLGIAFSVMSTRRSVTSVSAAPVGPDT